ncbi:MAG: MazG nucleotide pyrophosphohydrolase domain-containing protein [Candidatus Saccharimonadales bacterium]
MQSPTNQLNQADLESLKQIQAYIWQMGVERGFNEDLSKKMLMLTEEVGEIARAIRKLSGLKFDASTAQSDLAGEIADVFIVLLGLASLAKIDVAEAVKLKEEKNKKRSWK